MPVSSHLALTCVMSGHFFDLTSPLYIQIKTHTTGTNRCFYTKKEMSSCIMFAELTRRPKVVESVWWTAYHKVYKVYPNATTLKIERLVKGVWGLSPLVTKKVPVLVTVQCICNI